MFSIWVEVEAIALKLVEFGLLVQTNLATHHCAPCVVA